MKHKHLITRKRDYGMKIHLEDSPELSRHELESSKISY